MENKFLCRDVGTPHPSTDEAVRVLYGEGATLTVKKMLSQPGQFASANEKIRLVGPKGRWQSVCWVPPGRRIGLSCPSPMHARWD